jgi:Uncharacterized protein conserved in bacteria
MEDYPQQLPRMVVFAGPNGSGKSTVTGALMREPAFPERYINADEIQKKIDPEQYPLLAQRELLAANMAKAQRQEALDGGKPFAYETVMSTPVHLAMFDEARQKGFQVDMVFVTTESALINRQRVENRVAQGGHGVDPEKIVERYGRAMNMLPLALEKVDSAKVYDNTHKEPILVAEKANGKIVFPELAKPAWMSPGDFEKMTQWVDETIRKPVVAREQSLAAIESAQQKVRPDASVELADIQNGKVTSGRVIGMDAVHVVQHVRSEDRYVVHDRAMLTPGLTTQLQQAKDEGRDVNVGYHYDGGGKLKDQSLTLLPEPPSQGPEQSLQPRAKL